MENFKPLEMIVHNRQLWKSMNFLMTFLINFVFLFEQYL